MGLIELLIIILVLVIVFYLFDRFVVPIFPAPWGRFIEAILALIVIIWLLNRYLGLGL